MQKSCRRQESTIKSVGGFEKFAEWGLFYGETYYRNEMVETSKLIPYVNNARTQFAGAG